MDAAETEPSPIMKAKDKDEKSPRRRDDEGSEDREEAA
jgi:hypothetical protein